MSMDLLYIAWFVGRKEEGSRGLFRLKIEVFWRCCKFFHPPNLKETLANFFKIPTLSLFRVPVFLAYAWSSFGSILTQETRSKRLDIVEAEFPLICPVLEIIRFSALVAF